MFIIRLAILFISVLSQFFLQELNGQNADVSETTAKIAAYMQQMTSAGFSGALLVAKNDTILMSQGYGWANREQQIPVSAHTVFTTGSVTKQFTATAILKLQMQGKLQVQDAISQYFADVPKDKRAITLHHLLTHSAGLPAAIGDDFEPITRDAFIRLALDTPLLQAPGARYEYSNVGYSLLGAIIELVSGQSYESYVQENLFQPAGMSQTGYRLPQWQPELLAHGYRRDHDWGTLLDRPWADDGPYWHLRANGGVLSTIEDLYQWHLALAGDKILSAEAKKALYTPYVREGEDVDSFYGYGWAIFTTPRSTRLIAHNGGNGIFSADFLRYLDENVVVLAFSNVSDRPAWKVSTAIARIVFGYEVPPPAEAGEIMTAEALQDSPLGRHIIALISTINQGDEAMIRQFLDSHFAPRFLTAFPLDKHLEFFRRLHQTLGQAELVEVRKTGRLTAEFSLRSTINENQLAFTFELEPEEPFRIAGMGVEME